MATDGTTAYTWSKRGNFAMLVITPVFGPQLDIVERMSDDWVDPEPPSDPPASESSGAADSSPGRNQAPR